MLRAALVMSALALAALVTGCTPRVTQPTTPSPERWVSIKREIRTRFARVPHLTTDEVVTALKAEEPPLLVDVRARAEFAVSHLSGARNVPLETDLAGALADVARTRRVITYCSVGYRSSQAALKLRDAGFTNVANYLGSIFEWANRGLPMVDGRGTSHHVHPFDSDWGQMLRTQLHRTRVEAR